MGDPHNCLERNVSGKGFKALCYREKIVESLRWNNGQACKQVKKLNSMYLHFPKIRKDKKN